MILQSANFADHSLLYIFRQNAFGCSSSSRAIPNRDQPFVGHWLIEKQGRYHNGDQAARQLDMICSICGRRFAKPQFGVRWCRGWAHSVARPWVPISSPLTYSLSRTVFAARMYLSSSPGRPGGRTAGNAFGAS